MNLLKFKYDKYTTTGNDGIIEKVFDVLNIKKGFFVEFGAWDGIKGSNCRKLFEQGWDGIFIEPESTRFIDLKENYKEYENITCINSIVDRGENKFDSIVAEHIKDKIDFCSIDIDGLDLEIFESFEKFMPTVVCIEGGQMLTPNHERVPEHIAADNIQQSLKVMVDSFAKRGYSPICSYQDTFFVKEEVSHLFGKQKSIMELYLEGLEAHHRRMPWIRYMLERNGLNNTLIDYILKNTNYKDYGYSERKLWAVEQKEVTLHFINNLIEKYKKVAK